MINAGQAGEPTTLEKVIIIWAVTESRRDKYLRKLLGERKGYLGFYGVRPPILPVTVDSHP